MSLLSHIPSIVQRQLLDANSVLPRSLVSGGLSGAGVILCADSNGQRFCLRRWPREHPAPERLRLIHAGMQYAAAKASFVPRLIPLDDGATALYDGAHAWELTTWLDGSPDYLENPTSSRLEAAVRSVATVHNCWAGADDARLTPRYGPSPGMVQRQEMLQWWLSKDDWKQRVVAAMQQLTDDRRELFGPLAVRTLDLLTVIGSEILQALASLAAVAVMQHFVIRDLWSDHVLFDGDEVSGLIDFGAARIDEPAVDLSRLLGSLEPMDPGARRWAGQIYLEATCKDLTSAAEEKFFTRVDTLDRSSCLLSALQWLDWMVLQPRAFHVSDAFIASRWEAFLNRL